MKHAKKPFRLTKRKIIIGIGIVVLCLTILLILLLCKCTSKEAATIETIIRQEEPNAEQFETAVDAEEKIDHPEGGGGIAISYSTNVTLDFENGTAELFFQNPAISNQIMTLQIIASDTIIAQSGQIAPGYMVTELMLLTDKIPDTDTGEFYIEYFDEESNLRAHVNTRIPISITTKK